MSEKLAWAAYDPENSIVETGRKSSHVKIYEYDGKRYKDGIIASYLVWQKDSWKNEWCFIVRTENDYAMGVIPKVYDVYGSLEFAVAAAETDFQTRI